MGTPTARGEEIEVARSAAPRRCPLTAALNAVGGRWNMICLYWLNLDARRFNELQRLMPEISHKVLTETLRNLEQEGLIMRVECEGPLPYAEYRIAPHGNTLQPLIEAVRQWGRQHISWQAERAESQRSDCADGAAKG